VIVLPRCLARRFRAVLRRCAPHGRQAGLPPTVLLRAGDRGLCLEAARPDAAVRLEHPGQQPEAVLAFPADCLALFEGRGDDPVTLEEIAFGKGRASWGEGGSETPKDFPTLATDGLPPFPEPPPRLHPLDATFLRALGDAGAVAARDPTRYALERILLRGKGGQVVATDGRHLLVRSGFRLPWPDDALVSRLMVWGTRELPPQGPVGVGRTRGHVFVRVGPWTFALPCDPAGRFPAYEAVLPRAGSRASTLRLGPEDVRLLRRELPGLAADRELTVTLDFGPDVVVRAEPSGKGPTELRLSGARWSGPPLRVVTGPRHLLNALRLGFTEVAVRSPGQPLCCRDATRTYLWMPLGDPPAAPPATTAPPRTAPAEITTPPPSLPEPVKENPAMPTPSDNGRHAGHPDAASSPAPVDPLAEAEASRGLLAEAQARIGRLVTALKQHRRSARALEAAVASLRQLPPLSP
jgi:hypothetical protein